MKPEEKSFDTADGREFTFLFDIEGLIAVEDCANGGAGTANLNQIIAGAANGRIGYLRALVYGGLRANHPQLTRAQAFELIDSDGEALGVAMWPALFSAMPEKKEGKPGSRPPKAAGGTGSPSLPHGSRKASRKNVSGSKPRGATKS
jgi:hypothetical protein